MRRPAVFPVLSAIVLLSGLAAAILLCNKLVRLERAEFARRTEAQAQHIASQFESGIVALVEPLEHLGAWWISQSKPLDQSDWNSDARLFLTNSFGLRELFWVDRAGIERWSSVIGSDPHVAARPAREEFRRLITIAARREEAVFSGIIDIPGRQSGFYLCVPVRAENRFRGHIIGLYDAPELLSSLAKSRLPQDYGISVAFNKRMIYSAASPAQQFSIQFAHETPIRVLNRTWMVTVIIPQSYLGVFRGQVSWLGIVFAALVYACASLLYLSHRRSVELQRANRTLQDEIGKRTQAEASARTLNSDLKRQVVNFRKLLDVSPIGIAVSDDPECKSIWINPALARMMAVPQSLNISKSGPDAGKLPFRLCRNGKEISPAELPMQRAAATAQDVLDDELEIVRADGTVINVLSFAAPLFDEEGRVRGVLDACVDISERKARDRERARLLEGEQVARLDAELALSAFRESEAKFHRLFESDVIGIVIADSKRIVEANQSFLDMIGYTREDLSGGEITWERISPAVFHSPDQEQVRKLLSTGRLAAFEKEFIHKNGRHVPSLIGGTLLEQSFDWKAICFVLDLTFRRELEKRLQRALKMKSLGVMAAGIAHDFNGVLTSILGNAALAMESLPAGNEVRPMLESVMEAGHRAAELIHQVLAYTGRAFHTLRAIDLGQVIANMRPDLVRLAGIKAEIRLNLESPMPRVRADADEVRRVLTNVVVNAVEAIEADHGVIEVRAGVCQLGKEDLDRHVTDEELHPGTYVRVEIADTGCGMPSDVMARAFDPFFSTKFLGRGLGLSTVLGIMRAHYGTVRVESSPQKGTCVQLFFPANVEIETGPSVPKRIPAEKIATERIQ